jgi:hypothetical protein
MRLYLEGIGLCGPGLDGWEISQPVLAGSQPYVPGPTSIPPGSLLPANERRRAAQVVKIALAVGAEAFAAAGRDPSETATVFTSSGGDGDTIHEILSVLATPRRELSPIRFHNSVHNSAAGYWSIATGSRAASTSLCCHDDSFAAGLLEAGAQVVTQRQAAALIAYDVQYPAPLNALRPIGAAFAVAFVLSPVATAKTFAVIDMALQAGIRVSPKSGSPALDPALEMLRRNTPAARSLVLLEALARQKASRLVMNYLEDMTLALSIAPLQAGTIPCPASPAWAHR